MTQFIFTLWMTAMALATPASGQECVVLLHGLARSKASFFLMEWRLKREGYFVVNVDYPSKEATIEDLADRVIPEALERCAGTEKINFVTHSMGGILLRYYMKRRVGLLPFLGRSVMLGPPNKGTEIIDQLEDVPGAELWNGISGMQLGTGDDSLPNQLGAVGFDLGVIAGNQSISPILSAMIDGPNDGKVSVESTKVMGMAGHIVMPVTHTFMMNNPFVYDQVLAFLQTGAFVHPAE